MPGVAWVLQHVHEDADALSAHLLRRLNHRRERRDRVFRHVQAVDGDHRDILRDLMGMTLWFEYADGVAIVTIGDSPIITPSVTLDKTTATIASVGGTVNLTATTVPDGETVTWSSNDETVATVSNGTVTAVKAGEATITASITVDGTTYNATCTVTVSGA